MGTVYTRTLAIALIVLPVCVFGCAQNTEAVQAQPTRQQQEATTDQAAAGSQTSVSNEPVSVAFHFDAWTRGGDGGEGGAVDGSEAGGATGKTAKAGGGVVNIGTVNVSTSTVVHSGGSTTGAQTSGGASGQAATPTANSTQTPEQKPSASVSANMQAAAPGGSNQGSSSAAATSGANSAATSSLTSEQAAELRTLNEKFKSGASMTAEELARRDQLINLLIGGATAPTGGSAPR